MTLDTVRRTFTAWAPFYDATHAWPLPLRREARLALGVQRGDRVLDVACGTGLNFSHLRELVGEEGYVLGVDVTPAMLDIARQRIARRGWKNVEVREVDAAQLPFLDASFDKAICTFALSIIPDYVRAIEEARRVLVPGGRFVSLEMRPRPHNVPGWLKPLAGICAVDMSHRTLNELRRAFTDVQELQQAHKRHLAYAHCVSLNANVAALVPRLTFAVPCPSSLQTYRHTTRPLR